MVPTLTPQTPIESVECVVGLTESLFQSGNSGEGCSFFFLSSSLSMTTFEKNVCIKRRLGFVAVDRFEFRHGNDPMNTLEGRRRSIGW